MSPTHYLTAMSGARWELARTNANWIVDCYGGSLWIRLLQLVVVQGGVESAIVGSAGQSRGWIECVLEMLIRHRITRRHVR